MMTSLSALHLADFFRCRTRITTTCRKWRLLSILSSSLASTSTSTSTTSSSSFLTSYGYQHYFSNDARNRKQKGDDNSTVVVSEGSASCNYHHYSGGRNKGTTATPIQFRDLHRLEQNSMTEFLHQLRKYGFACIEIDDYNDDDKDHRELLTGLQDGISEASQLHGFRFPPHNTCCSTTAPISYTPSKRRAFCSLFTIATSCLRAILHASTTTTTLLRHHATTDGKTPQQQQQQRLWDALLEIRRNEEETDTSFRLFTNENEPFADPTTQPFAQSFFNLFNYKYGSLNAHVDRSLITVIHSSSPSLVPTRDTDNKNKNNNNDITKIKNRTSTLWIQDQKGRWHDADHSCCSGSNSNNKNKKRNRNTRMVIILIGEDLEEIGVASSLGLSAAHHAVRVNPTGPYIARSHYRPDPDEEEKNNSTNTLTTINNSSVPSQTNNNTNTNSSRVSTAFILRHDP